MDDTQARKAKVFLIKGKKRDRLEKEQNRNSRTSINTHTMTEQFHKMDCEGRLRLDTGEMQMSRQ